VGGRPHLSPRVLPFTSVTHLCMGYSMTRRWVLTPSSWLRRPISSRSISDASALGALRNHAT